MKENYYALLICILKPVTIEQGFDFLDGKVTKVQNKSIHKDDVEDMIRLKQEFTYEDIGRMYGLTKQAVYRRIKRYKEAVAV
jgi:DNA invertase Pin-like site-specific DNA recombinase